MKNYLLLVFVFFFCITCQHDKREQKNYTFYVGTYTQDDSKGIYQYQMDASGQLIMGKLVAETSNPSFLSKTMDGEFLLAVDETNVEGTGFVKSYKIEKDSLRFLSQMQSGGAHPCFVTVNAQNQVLVANYTGGTIGYLQLQQDGQLSQLLDIQQHVGKGTTSRQEAPHAHSALFHPNQKEIISVDLGTNALWFSKIDSLQKLRYKPQQKLIVKDGAGPRHLAFHPKKPWIYVLNELNNTVSLITKVGGEYQETFSVSTLPNQYEEYSVAAEIKITTDGKYLYTSNRGHHSITCFSIQENIGLLEKVNVYSTLGKTPRNFSLTPDNQFLVVANQDTNTLVSFSRNPKTGSLSFISEIEAPTPVCVLF